MSSANKLYRMYGPSLLAAAIGSTTVIWQTKSGNSELKADISRLDKKVDVLDEKVDVLDEKVDVLDKKVDMTNGNILTVTREAMAAMETRNYRECMHLRPRSSVARSPEARTVSNRGWPSMNAS